MADRILGPAYPALLAPGLRVVHSAAGVGTMVAAIPPSVVFDAAPGAVLVCDGPPDLRIDYADPPTRDRVARALAEHFREAAVPHAHGVQSLVAQGPAEWLYPSGVMLGAWYAWVHAYGRGDDRAALRAVAAAVWGPK